MLFPMHKPDFHPLNPGQMPGQAFRTIDRTVLTSGTSETYHQMRKAPLEETPHMRIYQSIYIVHKHEHLPVIFKEPYHRGIHSREGFIPVVFPGIMD